MSSDIFESEETQLRLKRRPYVRLILESMRAEEIQRSQGVDDSVAHGLNQRTEVNQNDFDVSGQSSTSGTSSITHSEALASQVQLADEMMDFNSYLEQQNQDPCSDTPASGFSSHSDPDPAQRSGSSSPNPSEYASANSLSSSESWATASASSLPRSSTSNSPSTSSEYSESDLDLSHIGTASGLAVPIGAVQQISIGIQVIPDPPIRPETFVLYMDPRYEFTQQKIATFYVETTRGEIFHGPTPFTPRVEAPNGYPIMAINVSVDPGQPNRYICTFQAFHFGVYIVSALIGNQLDYHVQRSPLSILISKLMVPNKDTITIMEPISEPGLDSSLSSYPNLDSPLRDTLRHLFQLQSPAKLFQNSACRAWGIAAHPFTQDVFVTSRAKHEILRYTYQGGVWNLIFRFGVLGAQPGYLNHPTGIAVDGVHNRVIIADKDNHRICIFTLSGQFISTFGRRGSIHGGEFCYPWGVAVSPNGNYIAVSDAKNFRIQLFDRNGTFLRLYNSDRTNPQEHNRRCGSPRGICFDNSGTRIYVSDFKLRNVFAFNLELTQRFEMFPRSLLRRPEGIAVDRHGNLLVCDTGSGLLEMVSRDRKRLKTVSMNQKFRPLDVTICFGGFLCFLGVDERLCLF